MICRITTCTWYKFIVTLLIIYPLQWRCNDRDGVWDHWPHDCLVNRIFRRTSKKTPKLHVTGRGIHRWPVNSPHKGPVTQKMFPFDDVIMHCSMWPTQVCLSEIIISLLFGKARKAHFYSFMKNRLICHWPAGSRIQCLLFVYLQCYLISPVHDDVIKWKHFSRYWPFVRGIHRSLWIPRTKASDAELWCFLWPGPDWVNSREAGDLRRHRGHYEVNVMPFGALKFSAFNCWEPTMHC